MAYEKTSATAHVQSLFDESTTQKLPLGTRLGLDDTRVYRYGLMGATASVSGSINQSAAAVANHINLAIQTATVIGDVDVKVTLGATATTLNQYAEGYLVANAGTGKGYTYKIRNHALAAASATQTVTIYDPIVVAGPTSAKMSLHKHPFKDVIIHPSAPTAVLVGPAAKGVLTAATYGWFQTWGPASVLGDGTPGSGVELAASDLVDGAVEVYAVATGPKVGVMLNTASVDTELRPVVLMLWP